MQVHVFTQSSPEPWVEIQIILHRNVLHNGFYQNCLNGSAPLSEWPAELEINYIFKQHLMKH